MIEHQGKIVDIKGDTLEILIQPGTACSACHAKGVCSSGSASEKTISVKCPTNTYKTGEVVIVKIEESTGYKAVFYAYVVPLLILFGALIVGENLLWAEWKTGLSILGLLTIYYYIFRFFGQNVTEKFMFKVEKINLTQ